MRIYATRKDNGKDVLLGLQCDHPDCDAAVKPHAEISKSGWTKKGFGGDDDGRVYCPKHTELGG